MESTLITKVALGVFGGRYSHIGVTGLTRVMGMLRSIVLARKPGVVGAPACRMFRVCQRRRNTALLGDALAKINRANVKR